MTTVPATGDVASTRRVLWLSALMALVLISAFMLTLALASRELDAVRASQEEVRQVRQNLHDVQRVLSALQDAETGERGYLITGLDEFLEPYDAAEHTLEEGLERLDVEIEDPQSRALLGRLAEDARRHLQHLREVVEIRRTEGPAAAAERVRQQIGKQQMDRLRGNVAQLVEREQSLLAQRADELRMRAQRSERLVQLSLCAAMLLVLAAMAMLIRHIQRRLKAERTASAAYGLLRSTLDNLTQGVAVFDPARRLRVWNARFLELRGLERSQVYERMPLREVLQQAAHLTIGAPVRDRSGTLDVDPQNPPAQIDLARDFDAEASHADGSQLQVRGRRMEGGNFIVTYTDVTTLKLSELAYREQATRLASILDNIVDAIVTINECGGIESWSEGAVRLFGYQAHEVLGRNVRMLIPEPHASRHDGYIRRYIETGERRVMGQRREVEALLKDGRRILVDLGVSEIRIGSRRLFIGIVSDLSSRAEIEQLKSSFVSTVSHELRTPLTSIAGSLGLLAGGTAGALPAKASRLVDIAHLNCQRLVRRINDILDLERVAGGGLPFQLESQALKPIVQQAIEASRAYAEEFGVTIALDVDAADATVLVDRERLMQVLTNILSNAAKFSPRGGTVTVAIRSRADQVCVSVRDEGPGIAPEFRARIFEKFAQADSSDSRARSGTGLGLSIARMIVERLGGTIGFESAPGNGATFLVTLPARRRMGGWDG